MPRRAPEYLESRREEILDGARRCFARWGYERATVPRLKAEIGLSHGAIFNYFPTKFDLFLELARRDHERWDRIWLEEGFEALAQTIVAEDPAWIGVYLEFERRLRTDRDLRRRYRRDLHGEGEEHAWLDAERAAGRIRDDLPPDAIRSFLHLLLDGLAVARASGVATIDLEPILQLARDAIAPRA